MNEYTVEIVIDVTAETAEEAADWVLNAWLRCPKQNAFPVVVKCTDYSGKITQVEIK